MGLAMKQSPDIIRQLRETAFHSHSVTESKKMCADEFGYTLHGWHNKETNSKDNRRLTRGEFLYLALLANEHPDYLLINRHPNNYHFLANRKDNKMTYLMNPATGSVDTEENWIADMTRWELYFKKKREEFYSLVEVVKNERGEWVEVK